MTQQPRLVLLPAIVSLFWLTSPAGAEPITFSARPTFIASIGSGVVDTYNRTEYFAGDLYDGATTDQHTDAHMGAVLGQTKYHPTFWPESNLIIAQGTDAKYCAGCNGSFLLTFGSTSFGGPDGVFGVGFDFGNTMFESLYGVEVTFGDGSVQRYPLPFAGVRFSSLTPGFWGIVAPERIFSIHFGTNLGASVTKDGSFVLDNLTIGAAEADVAPVPEPGTLLLAATGIWAAARRRRRWTNPGAQMLGKKS